MGPQYCQHGAMVVAWLIRNKKNSHPMTSRVISVGHEWLNCMQCVWSFLVMNKFKESVPWRFTHCQDYQCKKFADTTTLLDDKKNDFSAGVGGDWWCSSTCHTSNFTRDRSSYHCWPVVVILNAGGNQHGILNQLYVWDTFSNNGNDSMATAMAVSIAMVS